MEGPAQVTQDVSEQAQPRVPAAAEARQASGTTRLPDLTYTEQETELRSASAR
jgi:hypothetical protein